MMYSVVESMLMLDGDSEHSAAAFNQQIPKYSEIVDRLLNDTVQ
jgi:hypothetical protein